MSFNVNNILADKVTSVNGIPGDIVIFGIDGTIADSGVPVSIGSGQAKQPSAIPGDLAIFGSGPNLGQTIDSGLVVNDSSLSSPSVLWSSQKIESLLPSGGPFLPLSGGTMTGTITSANIVVPTGDVITITDLPTVGTSAANKTYVDSKISPGGPFLPLAGGTMSGNIIVPSGDLISIADAPAAANSAANKAYVDAQVSAGVPNATPTTLGKIQLAGDFDITSTATVPVIKAATTTSEGKIQLSGDFDPSSTASIPVIKSASTTVEGKVQLAGDLTGTATSPLVANGAITLPKMAPLSATSKLIGSGASTTVSEIGVGGSLEISGGILQENIPNLSTIFLPLAGGTMSGNIIVPTGDFITITDPPTAGTGAANKAYVDANITPNATPTVLGKIQLAGDIAGVATAPVVAPGAITLSKMSNLGAVSNLIGSSSTTVSPSYISLGANLQMLGTTLNVNTAALSGTFLPLAGGTMSGNIVVPTGDLISIADAPIGGTSAVNKTYVDSQITLNATPNATSTVLGKIQLTGDLLGSVATLPTVSPGAITLSKLSNLSAPSELIGSSSTSSAAANITLGTSLSMSGTSLNVVPTFLNPTFNGTIGGSAILGVPNGGTGDSSLTGYVVGNGTAPFTAVTTIPVANVNGAVQSVNGVFPVAGNVTVALGTVTTGTLAALPPVGPPLVNGDIYVVSGDPTPSNNGITFIYSTNPTNQWLEISPTFASLDARYLQLAGGTMAGNIVIPGGNFITLTNTPVNPTDASNKAYVDANITPSATTLIQGKVQLAGDLAGVASAPVVTTGAITLTKMANLTTTSALIGSSSTTTSAAQISLGSNLQMSGTTLDVNTTALSGTFLPLAGGTMSGNIVVPTGDLISIADAPTVGTSAANKAYVDANITPNATSTVLGKIQLTGDLLGSVATLPTVAPGAITLSKMANLTSTMSLIGSSSTSNVAAQLSLGSNLQISGTTLNVNTAALSGTFLPLAGGTMAGNIVVPTGDLISIADAPTVGTSAANKAYVDAQISAATPQATSTVFGTIKLTGDLLGSTAALPTVAPLSISTGKLANLGAPSQILGSGSASSSAAQLSLGSNLQITGTTLNVNTAALSGTFLPLVGGTMAGNIIVPTGDLISIADAPTVGTSAANKAYVDAQIIAGTPNATTTTLGKIQLAGDFDPTSTATVPVIRSATASVQGKIQLTGDLTGTASSPTVAAGAITLAKMANLGGSSQIIGSSSTAPTPVDLSLGSGLQISGTVLSVNSATLVVPPATATTIGGIEMLGDLTGSVATAPTVAAGAITLAKMANLGGTSQIIGSSSTTTTPVDLTLGSGLQISGTVLSVNSATLVVPPATASTIGGIEMLGDLTGSVATAPTITAGAITLAKMANLSGNSQIIGSSSTSSAPVDLTLGSFLQISGTTLDANTTALSGVFLPLSGGTMSGNITIPTGDLISIADAPSVGTSAANKAYVDAQIIAGTPNATTTTLGKIQLAGDFDPTSTATVPVIRSATASVQGKIQLAGDLTGTASLPTVAAGAITLAKMANLGGTSQIIGSSSTAATPVDLTLGSGLQISGTVLSVTAATASTLGGIEMLGDLTGSLATAPTVAAGAITLAKMANLGGTSQIIGSSSTTSTPVDLTLGSGLQISGTVLSVNSATLVVPPATASTIGGIEMLGDLTGSLATAPTVAPGAITLAKMANLSGNSQIIGSSSTASTPVDLTLASSLQISGTVLSVNTTTLASTFLPLAGGTMSGNIIIPTGDIISIADAPAVGTSAANKTYVDSQIIANATPSATTGIQGKVQLAGDLGGSGTVASAPIISAGAITLTKMANLSGSSQLIGSGSTSSSPVDLTLGSGLQISGTVLSVNSATLVVPPATASTIGGIEMLGDLTGSVATAPTVAAGAITLAKMANLGGTSQIIGSSSTTATPTDLTLGSGLQISGTVLSVNSATLVVPPATASTIGGIEMLGDLTGSVATAPTVAAGAITLSKMANLGGTSQIIGSSSTTATPVDLTLGSGLQISGTVLSVTAATASTLGGIEMLGDLTGSVATAPTVAAGAITLAKMANLGGTSQIIGSSSTAVTPVDLTLGSGLQISGTVLSVNSATLVVPPATASTIGGIEMLGDLTGSVATAPTVAAGAITLAKMANLGGTSQIIGSSSTTATPVDLTLGSGLQISGTVLSVTAATASTIGGIEMLGDLTGSLATAPTVAAGAITLSKMANLGGTSQIIGSSSTTTTPVDLTLGSGLQISGTVLSITAATASTLGGIEMLGDLTGSVATAPTVAAGAITLAKMANLAATSQLIGSSSTTTSPADITLGTTLQMSGTTLSVNTTTLQSTFMILEPSAVSGNIAQFNASGQVVDSGNDVGDFMILEPAAVSGHLGSFNGSGQIIDSGVSINNAGLTSASLWNAAKLAVTTNSWFAGTNPNTTAPTDRPQTSSVLYVGTDASTWIWNGTVYISLTGAKVPATATRTFTTGTGATGFQISATNGAFVYYSVSISTTIGVGGTSTGTVFLEVAPTNSATPAAWIVNGEASNSQSFAGLLTLTSVQVEGSQLATYVPAGYFAKLRTTSSGTASFTFIAGIEVLDN